MCLTDLVIRIASVIEGGLETKPLGFGERFYTNLVFSLTIQRDHFVAMDCQRGILIVFINLDRSQKALSVSNF